jgi:hypothetical protein
MSSSTFSFEREIPRASWTLSAVLAALLVLLAVIAWELQCRRMGYAPTVNDTDELWASTRAGVKPDSLVIIGDSRAWFDLDLAELERGLGRKPVQLAMPGSTVHPVLVDLANDEHFHGTVLCSVVPSLFFVPEGFPLVRPREAVAHYHRMPLSENLGLPLSIFLEERFAFMNIQELTLEELLKSLPIPNRPGLPRVPSLPPYFNSMTADRQARMIERCIQPGPLQERVKQGWLPLFTPPPPPPGVTAQQAMAAFHAAAERRLEETAMAVARIRRRGGQVVFLRLPSTGELKALEDKLTPRAQTWEPILKVSGAPGIYYEDHPDLRGFECPEWSHLVPADATEFTKRLVLHLRPLLAQGVAMR